MIRLALAQIAPALGDLRANLALHRQAVLSAKRAGADLVVFPELSLTGYLLKDLTEEVAVEMRGSPAIEELLSLSRRLPFVVGLVERGDDQICYNSALFLAGGSIVHRHRKVYLPTYGMFEEGRTFGSGSHFQAFSTRLGRFGILLCEDAWHLSSSYLLALDGAECLLISSSGPLQPAGTKQSDAWMDLCRAIARFLTVHVVYVNRVGVEDGIHFAGGSFAMDPLGRIVGRSPFLEEAASLVRISPAMLRRARTGTPLLRDERPDLVLQHLERMARSEPDGAADDRLLSERRPRRARVRNA